MKDFTMTRKNNLMENCKILLNETDIRHLVFVPSFISFGAIIVWYLIASNFPEVSIPLPVAYMGLSLFFFIQCLSGFAEVYKREMPGPFGGVIKGKSAVIAGIFIMVIFAIPSFATLIYAFVILLK